MYMLIYTTLYIIFQANYDLSSAIIYKQYFVLFFLSNTINDDIFAGKNW